MTVDDPDALAAAASVLRGGGAVVIPTETVYGVAALPSVAGATETLFALKGRPTDVPLAVLVDDLAQVLPWLDLDALPAASTALAERFWPGPLTLVLPRRAGLALALGGSPATVGVRCPDHGFARALAAEVGPVATTSANRHGEPTPHTAADAAAALAGAVDLVVDGGRCDSAPSTVVDLTGVDPVVVRAGAIEPAAIDAVIRDASNRRPPP
jgi:L-threonylcarbamoyladenylate synthase